ncbi:hypothetical protein FISHEDRAFT_58530 [Fistulina hepatica ATCC 64428]|uniref:DUF6534 domain-containing protein n=1 Tax=Fistulina hepatica ATCC 64428 TaxID=1128425 RepID=A0A0D7AED6_9AGAR|nr:hypothetical protein FISHEDRAFT_58530 [Fistulina hepatica ATCC 64428]
MTATIDNTLSRLLPPSANAASWVHLSRHRIRGRVWCQVILPWTATPHPRYFSAAGALQTWMYFRRYTKRDHWLVQATVFLVFVLDTCQMGILTDVGDAAYIAVAVPDIIIELIFQGCIAFVVQLIWKSMQAVLTISVLCLKLTRSSVTSQQDVALGIIRFYVSHALQTTYFADLLVYIDYSTTTNALAAGADVLITVTTIATLQRAKTGFRKSTDMLNRLIIFTFNTCIPTTLCAVVCVIMIHASPDTFIYIFFYLMLGRFYTNSLLVTLNSRNYIRGASGADNSSNSFSASNSRGQPSSGGMRRGPTRQGNEPIAIQIHSRTTNHYDDGKNIPMDDLGTE